MMKLMIPILFMSPLLYGYSNYLIFTTVLMLFMVMKFNNLYLLILNKFMFMDLISWVMILLSIFSIMMIMISSFTLMHSFILISLIMILLIMTFSSLNMFFFYMMFEIILIPTLILITKVGYQPERLQAGIYLMIYTITASLPLLLAILYIKTSPNFLLLNVMCEQTKNMIFFTLAFLVKMPMFLLHLWLPKAHVEAPVEGSMILAAILLKLGGFGIIRFSPMLYASMKSMNIWIMSISLIGAIMTSMNCSRQKDLKALIAYSSVAHMGLVLASLMTFNYLGLLGSIIMMVAHGISSSALFLLVNMIYTKYHTRNIISLKGLWSSFPNITFWWFLFLAANISAPPSINLSGEIFMLMSMLNFNLMIMFLLILISLMTSIFSINLFMNTIHNSPNCNIANNSLNKMYLCLMLHSFPLILMILKLDLFMF